MTQKINKKSLPRVIIIQKIYGHLLNPDEIRRLKKNEAIIAKNVTENIWERHILQIFGS